MNLAYKQWCHLISVAMGFQPNLPIHTASYKNHFFNHAASNSIIFYICA